MEDTNILKHHQYAVELMRLREELLMRIEVLCDSKVLPQEILDGLREGLLSATGAWMPVEGGGTPSTPAIFSL